MNTPTICRASHDTAAAETCPAAADLNVLHPADLHAWANGDLGLMSAVRLLDDTGLLDHAWTLRFIDAYDGLVCIDFRAMRRDLPKAPLAGGEKALAGAAVSLAAGLKIDLGATLLALDADNIGHLVVAVGVIARSATMPPRPFRPTLAQALAVGA
ncbi:hypothetical protein [Glycomyces sp. NPDC048151]|uniref:hypothetical protein n=1 Tax=Glycomyces sp. NPDC048151 TaxID=3364002 RepID=UPI00371D367B